ncbi:hypothetical protein [Brevundimonas sp.]|uniref:hypothetical protein n=1 Tax=Brevundimonas sp. TaxID=1871086 RepID=UPI003BAD8E8C
MTLPNVSDLVTIFFCSFAFGVVAFRVAEGIWGASLWPQLASGWGLVAFCFLFTYANGAYDPFTLPGVLLLASTAAGNSLMILFCRRYLPPAKDSRL